MGTDLPAEDRPAIEWDRIAYFVIDGQTVAKDDVQVVLNEGRADVGRRSLGDVINAELDRAERDAPERGLTYGDLNDAADIGRSVGGPVGRPVAPDGFVDYERKWNRGQLKRFVEQCFVDQGLIPDGDGNFHPPTQSTERE